MKSYLPAKDAHVRPGIDGLLGILRNILSYGEISKELQSRYISLTELNVSLIYLTIISFSLFHFKWSCGLDATSYSFMTSCSSVDKAHLRLASAKAVLRLSRLWDHKIPVDIFHLTLRVTEVRSSFCILNFLCSIYDLFTTLLPRQN